MKDIKRWRGLGALIGDAVDHGASAIERVHLDTARRPFAILEQVPAVSQPAQEIHAVHDTVVSGVYTSVRLVNRMVGKTLDAALAALDESPEPNSAAVVVPSEAE
jgi:hypothetical protein